MAERDLALGVVPLAGERVEGPGEDPRARRRARCSTVRSEEPESSTTTSSQPRSEARQPGSAFSSLRVSMTTEYTA